MLIANVRTRKIELIPGIGGESYLTSDASLEGDTPNKRPRKLIDPFHRGDDKSTEVASRRVDHAKSKIKADSPKTEATRVPTYTTVNFGASSKDASLHQSDGTSTSKEVSKSDSLKTNANRKPITTSVNFGVSSKDASLDPSEGMSISKTDESQKRPEALANTVSENFGVSSMVAELPPIGGKLSDTSDDEVDELTKLFPILTINQGKRHSLRDVSMYIWDTAAAVCICNNRAAFVEGSLQMIPDNQISIVGWNTSHGPAIALAVGRLKYLDIDAYYSEDAVGNILGEPAMLKEFQAVHEYVPGQMFKDRITVTRLKSRKGEEPMIFSRGIEGIMICPVPGVTNKGPVKSREDLVACSTLISDLNDPVFVWLEAYGLTEREVRAAVVLRKLSEENRHISVKKMMCVLENNHNCKADKAYAKYVTFKSIYTEGKRNKVMESSSAILENLRSWLPMSDEMTGPMSNDKETCNNKTCQMMKNKVTEQETCSNKTFREIETNMLSSANSETMSKHTVALCGNTREITPSPGSLASNFSVGETWAALSISKLKLSYGELMVALFAVEAGLANAYTFVNLTLQQKGYSVAGIARLERVEDLHRITSFVNLRTLKDMLLNGVIKVDGLRPQDVEKFRRDVHNTGCSCHEGKITLPSAIKFKENELNLSELCTTSCHIDVMDVTTNDKSHRYLNLIGVDAATQCIIEVRVPDVSEKAIAAGLIIIENWYKKHNKVLTQFVLDNAGSFSAKALIEECARRGITVVHVTPDLHVKLAEAAVKIVKSLARTTIVDRTIRGKFVTSFIPHLITWIVGSINCSLRSMSREVTPGTKFTGTKISINIHFRAAFCDIVIVNKLVQERTKNLESRGIIGLVLGRDRSERGALNILNLETMKMIKRYHFKRVKGESYTKFVNEKLQDPIFLASYIALDDSEIANADIDSFEVSGQEILASHIEIERLIAKSKNSVVEGEVAETAVDNNNNTPVIHSKFPYKKVAKSKKAESTDQVVAKVSTRVIRCKGLLENYGRPQSRSSLKAKEIIKNSEAFTIRQLSDGTCMFASICQYFDQSSDDANPLILRDQVCNFMENNLDFVMSSGQTVENVIDMIREDLHVLFPKKKHLRTSAEYIEYMRNVASYGDQLELSIISIIRKVGFIIFEELERGGFQFCQEMVNNCEEGKIIYLNYSNNIHYETLIIEKESVKAAHRVKYQIPPRENLLESSFNYDLNNMKPKEFNHEEHEEKLAMQLAINNSTKDIKPLEINNSKKDVIKDPMFNPETQTYAESFEEEIIESYSEMEKQKYTVEKLIASISTIAIERPYSNEYEKEYEPMHSEEIHDLSTDNEFIECCEKFQSEEVVMSISMKSKSEPRSSLKSRVGDEAIIAASKAEMTQLLKKRVFNMQDQNAVYRLKNGSTPITPLINLVKEKLTSEGLHEKVKSRIIVLGNLQAKLPKAQTEAPTGMLTSFYLLIFIATKRGIRLCSFDVTGAFLNADLKEDESVYVRLDAKMTKIAVELDPTLAKYVLSDGTMVAKLTKCLYGMAISPQRWFYTILDGMKSLGFQQSLHDPCFFHKIEGDVWNCALLFVDDILPACENKLLLNQIHEMLIREFEGVSKQEGNILSYLGFTITQYHDRITLDQSGYILKMVKSLEMDMDKIPIYRNPFASNFKVDSDRYLKPATDAEPKMVWLMKHLAMTLMYIATRTRRDLLFAASFFAGVKCPTLEDIAAVKRAIIYAYNTIDKKQTFYRQGEISMTLAGDASNSLFADTRGQGCAIVFGDASSAALEMTANVEKFFSKSSFQSELVLQNKLAMMGKRTMLMFKELKITVPSPMTQFCDHLEVVKTMNKEHLLNSGGTKFMSRNLFQLFAEVLSRVIDFFWVSSERNLADIGTKPLQGKQFVLLADQTFSRLVGLPEEDSKEDSRNISEEQLDKE